VEPFKAKIWASKQHDGYYYIRNGDTWGGSSLFPTTIRTWNFSGFGKHVKAATFDELLRRIGYSHEADLILEQYGPR
jgi:hypothetical protein